MSPDFLSALALGAGNFVLIWLMFQDVKRVDEYKRHKRNQSGETE